MTFNFFKKLAFGLDLSDRSLKIVQLKQRKGVFDLVSFGDSNIPDGIVQNGEIKKKKELVSVLNKALDRIKGEPLQSRRVVCNLPKEKVFIQVIHLPQMKEEEIAQAVKWEAEAHIPLSIDEVYLDWQIIGSSAQRLDILIAAAPRVIVKQYLSFLKATGLEPVALEPESLAVVRSLVSFENAKPTIIIDLGATGTNFVIFADSAIRFTSYVKVSGQLFTKAIMKKLKVDAKEAEKMKIKVGLDKAGKKSKVYQALEPIINDMSRQIKNYISFYKRASDKRSPISQLLLCGGDSLLLNLPQFLGEKLDFPVRLGNSLVNVVSADKRKQQTTLKRLGFSKRESLTYAIAIGLALREIEIE